MLRKIFFSVAVLAIGMGNVHSEVITFKIFSGRQIPIEVDTIANLNDLKQALADKLNTDVDHVTTDRVRVEFKKKDINDGNFEELKAGLPHTASTNVYVSSAPAPAHSTRITFMVISTRQIPIEMNTIANLDGLKKALANKLNKDVDHVTTDRVKVALEYNLEHKKILKDITDDNFKALKGKFSLADKCSVNVSPAPAPAPAPAAPVVVSVPVPTGQRRNPRSIVPTTPPARSRSLVDRRAVAGLAAVGSAFVIAK
ncbi:hypothetical protein FJ366_03250, partial [Candidatus Dependentiae bacterium]|nr:hypothetical protein [Candidatus Dependentiae bacterium]